MNRVVLIAAVALVAACGGAPTQQNYKQEQTPVTPKGTIVGRIVDMSSYAPLEGVKVTPLGAADAAPLTTNADGVFTLRDAVVSSSYLFVMEKAGYLRQTVSASLSASTGNSPLEGPITAFNAQMYKADGEVRGNVFLPDGKPAANATVIIDNKNAGYGDGVVTATTDAAGFFKLTGVAAAPRGLSTTVYALWYDENNDQLADYGTTSVNVAVHPGVVERVFLTYTSLGQRIIGSNVFDAELPPSEDLQFTFALPVLNSNLNQQAYRAFVLTNLTRNSSEVAVEATWASAVQVSVHPVIPLREGERYNIAIAVTNASAGANNAAPNFTTNLTFQVRSGNISPITDQVQNFSVVNPNISATRGPRSFDWNTSQFRLTWDAVANAVAYAVYAKDTNYNPNYVQVTTITTLNLPRYTTDITLNSNAFDPSGNSRPLALNNKVTFTVVPIDVYGNMAPLNAAPTVQVADNVQPQATGYSLVSPASGTVDAANDEAAPIQIALRLSYNEPMDPTTLPAITTSASGVTQTFVWDNYASNSGLLTITIGSGLDASGPFTIRGGRDMAGNPLLNNDMNGSFAGRKEIGTNWNFEDASGTCTLNGWTAISTGGFTVPAVAVNNSSSRGRCAAALGALPGTAPQLGTARLYQDVALPSLTNTPNWSLEMRVNARPVYYASPAGTPGTTQRCGLADTSNVFLSTAFAAASSNANTYTAYSTNASTLAAQTVRLLCEINNPSSTIPATLAIYLDELSIATVKPGLVN